MTPGFDRTLAICAERLDLSANATLLDVPCGKGEAIVRLAASFGCHCIGIDRSPMLLEAAAKKIARSNVHDRARLCLGDGGRLPFGDQAFDACLSIGGPSCIGGHHIRDALAEQARVLKPGGFLVASDMLRDESNPNPWIASDHPDAGGWWNLLEASGLRVLYFEHLDISAWDEYHAPMRDLVAEVRRNRSEDMEMMAWADRVEREIAMDLPKNTEWANYGTFIAQRP
jgi:SAM-dependent methyltransferase